MTAQHIPHGYWENATGALIPDANVKEIDKLRDQTVRTIFEKVYEIHDLLKNFKDSSFSDMPTSLKFLLINMVQKLEAIKATYH